MSHGNITAESIKQSTERYLLENGGVDNWEWYDESLKEHGITGDDNVDNADWLRCLENGGVDNWTWYDESLRSFSEYSDYIDSIPKSKLDDYMGYEAWEAQNDADNETNENIVPEIVDETPKPWIEDEGDEILYKYCQEILAEEDVTTVYNDAKRRIFKKNAFPKEFYKATNLIGETGITKLEARVLYINAVIASKKLSPWLEKVKNEG